MNFFKAAAVLTLLVALCAGSYLGYIYYDDKVNMHSTIAVLTCADKGTQCGEDYTARQYEVSAAVTLVALVASLALFGAAQKVKP